MGAWGTGNFQNDDALDWLGELGDFDTVRTATSGRRRCAGLPSSSGCASG